MATQEVHKFTKLLKPSHPTSFSELIRVEKILVSSYFDDPITINSSYASCHRYTVKVLFISLVFVPLQFVPFNHQSPSSQLLNKLNI